MYALPIWTFKPHLSHTSCKKGRAGRAAGNKIGGKKNKSSKRGSTGASSVITAFI